MASNSISLPVLVPFTIYCGEISSKRQEFKFLAIGIFDLANEILIGSNLQYYIGF